MHTYIAYIDESGDEGFNLAQPPKRKSSEWFVISAIITRVSDDEKFDNAVAKYLEASGKQTPFHFADVRHESRIGFIQLINQIPFSFTSVLAHKPSPKLVEAKKIGKESHFLFYYTAKLLLERITWFCEYDCSGRANNVVKVIFSDRGQLKRGRLIQYLNTLREKTEIEEFLGVDTKNHDIKWKYLDNDLIEICEHNSLAGLQAADAIASSLRAAVEFTPHFATEHRYAKLLASRVWRRYLKIVNYGLKFVPELPPNIYKHTNRFHWLRHYGWLKN